MPTTDTQLTTVPQWQPPPPIDTCPKCGKGFLIASCEVTVLYAIVNSSDDDKGNIIQEWERDEVWDDDMGQPYRIQCVSCQGIWEGYQTVLDDEGFLVMLDPPEAPEDLRCPLCGGEITCVARASFSQPAIIGDARMDDGDFLGSDWPTKPARCNRCHAPYTPRFEG
jgi:hypothetical protein